MIFVLGSREAVGKTLVAMSLLRLADKLDIRAAGMKPVQTGCPYTEDHDLWARDGDVLRASVRKPLPPLVTSPYRFPTPGAPAIAARRAGLDLTAEDLIAVVETASEPVDLLVVEGTGGVDTEIAEGTTTAQLAERLAGRTVLVADGQDDLDKLVQSIGFDLAGVILTRTDASDDPRVIATIPTLGEGDDPAEVLERAGLGETLLKTTGER